MGTILGVTVVPLLAVTVVLPFAGRVAVAFHYSPDVAAPQLAEMPGLSFFFGPLSRATMSPPSGTITGKVTGGGTICGDGFCPPRSRSFGYVAIGEVFINPNGTSNCTPATPCPAKGHLNYVNHTTDPQVHVNGKVEFITNFVFTSTGSGKTKGTVTFTGTDTKVGCGEFTVTVTDNSEPGTDDRFGLQCSFENTPGPGIDRQHSGGNSQIHPPQSK